MIYSASILTEAKRAYADRKRTFLKICKGLVWHIEVEFPAGCCGLTHIQIFDGSYQVFPASPGDSMHSDGAVLSYDDLYLKTSAPFELVVETWNLDETWPHTLQVRIGVASTQAFMARYMPSITWEKFGEAMKQAAIDQEAIRQSQIALLAKQIGGE